jgi:peptidoglycan/LPS O-acetylase OafA/YrhL
MPESIRRRSSTNKMESEPIPINSNARLLDDLRSPTLVSYLDVSRWLAAAMVFLGHLRNPLFLGYGSVPIESRTIAVKLWYFVTGLHAEAVIMFFVLSGLLVAGVGAVRVQAKTFDVSSYAIDRFSRLYVAFLPALLLCFITDLIGSTSLGKIGFWDHTHPMIAEKVNTEPFESTLNLQTLALNSVMLQTYFVSPVGSNHPLWTISTEFWFYVVFGVAALAWMKQGLGRLVSAALLGVIFMMLGSQFPVCLGYWLIGMLIAWAPPARWLPPLASLSLFAVVLFIVRLWQADFESTFVSMTVKNYAVASAFALTILSIRGRKIPLLERTAGFSKFMADFSYSLYLLHFPLMLFFLACLYAAFGWSGLATGYSPTSSQGLMVYSGIIIVMYFTAWGFSRLTEARTVTVRQFLKARLANRG